jgi:predicted AAA+ superfamily ATPase
LLAIRYDFHRHLLDNPTVTVRLSVMFARMLEGQVLQAMKDTPVVFVAGSRQTGKSTLVQAVQAGLPDSGYRTMDDLNTLASARRDPKGFVEALPSRAFLDEVQRAPEVFLPIKAAVDRDRRPGRFVLTGSANVLALPRMSDSLAGRMEILTLWPLAQAESEGTSPGFIDACFSGQAGSLRGPGRSRTTLLQRVLAGGYPEALARATGQARARWFDGYLTTLVQRDVRDLAQIEGVIQLPPLLATLAARAGSPLNFADLGRNLAMNQMTVKRYIALFEALFLVVTLPPWSDNLGKRLAKTAKIYFNDAGLLAHLLGVDADGLAHQSVSKGALVENFAVMELMKLAANSQARPSLFHFRTSSGQEVDVVMETRRRDLVGVEIKSAATVADADFRGLHNFAAIAGKRLRAGIVLYAGRETLPFGDRMWAVPLEALWAENR